VFVNDDPLNGTDPLGKDSAGFLFVRHCDASPACKNAPFTWDEIASITMIVIGLTTIVASGGVTATLIPMLAEDISGPSATTFSAAMAIAHGAYVLAPSVAATAGAMGVVVQALRMAFTEASKTISPVKQKKK